MKIGQECSVCGRAAKLVPGSYDLGQLQMPGVVLHGIEILTCDACGNADPILPELSRIMKVLAIARIRKPAPLLGEDVRSLRTFLKMDRKQFASVLHVPEKEVAAWEGDKKPIQATADRLIRAIVLAMGELPKDEVEGALHSFEDTWDAPRSLRIELDVERMQYHYVSEPEPAVSR